MSLPLQLCSVCNSAWTITRHFSQLRFSRCFHLESKGFFLLFRAEPSKRERKDEGKSLQQCSTDEWLALLGLDCRLLEFIVFPSIFQHAQAAFPMWYRLSCEAMRQRQLRKYLQETEPCSKSVMNLFVIYSWPISELLLSSGNVSSTHNPTVVLYKPPKAKQTLSSSIRTDPQFLCQIRHSVSLSTFSFSVTNTRRQFALCSLLPTPWLTSTHSNMGELPPAEL